MYNTHFSIFFLSLSLSPSSFLLLFDMMKEKKKNKICTIPISLVSYTFNSMKSAIAVNIAAIIICSHWQLQ